jgi:hypothetical protein
LLPNHRGCSSVNDHWRGLFSGAGFKILRRWRSIGRTPPVLRNRGVFFINTRQKIPAFLNKARALLHLIEKLGQASHDPRHAFPINGAGAFKRGQLAPHFLAVWRHAESSPCFPQA